MTLYLVLAGMLALGWVAGRAIGLTRRWRPLAAGLAVGIAAMAGALGAAQLGGAQGGLFWASVTIVAVMPALFGYAVGAALGWRAGGRGRR